MLEKTRILFVCLGNICRSPLAEGIFRKVIADKGLAKLVEIDSAGTGDWHRGEAPDHRSIAAAARNGLDISGLRARQVRLDDFNRFDMIFAMDRSNLRDLVKRAPHDSSADLHLFMDFIGGEPRDVPDPYSGGDSDFDAVYAMLAAGCDTLAAILFPRGKAELR